MFKAFTSAPFRKDKGFTLVELMVVMTIISIMTAVVLANYRAGGQQLALDRSANKLAQDIRRAQEMAMSATECPTNKCGGPLAIIPDRYGIYSKSSSDSPTSSLIFADRDNDGKWDPSADDEIETLHYEKGVYLSDISGPATCSGWPFPPGLRRFHITFKPPDPTTELKVGWAASLFECSEIVLTLGVEGYSQTRTVKVNNAGLIYVE